MIDVKKVKSVYSGIYGKCMCGCSGKHTYHSSARGCGMALRGYEIREAEIDDAIVKRHVNTIDNSGVAVDHIDQVEAVIGNRIYVAYYNQ